MSRFPNRDRVGRVEVKVKFSVEGEKKANEKNDSFSDGNSTAKEELTLTWFGNKHTNCNCEILRC